MQQIIAQLVGLLTFEPVFYSVLALAVLYLIFVQLMRYKRRRESDGRPLALHEWAFVAVLILVGYPLDVVLNVTVGSLIFLDPPRTLTLSQRMDRYVDQAATETALDRWRLWLSRKAAPLLNQHDRGHIG